MLRLTIALAAGLAIAAPSAAQAPSVKAGVEAWQKGDFGRATGIWQTLAENGDADAAFNLGQAYRLGRGVAASSSEAAIWFERAAKKGHLDAQVSLGLLLFDSGDRARALQWLLKAAARNEPRALLVTGTALFNGDGIARDAVRGYAYVSHAAAQGLQPAQTTLAEMDKVMSRADRQKGVAMALEAARGKPNVPISTPAPAKAKTAPALVSKVVPASSISPSKVIESKAGAWRVQLGAFSTKAAAQGLFGKLGGKLGGAQAYYVVAGAVTRLQVGPFASKADAAATCALLKPQPCFPVAAN
ncbi:MAG: SPOR domain-containing protein [Sphingomicrobium sp.]